MRTTATISLRKIPTTKINAEVRRRQKRAAALTKKRKALEARIKRLDKKINNLGVA
jgi:cell division protein FtsB